MSEEISTGLQRIELAKKYGCQIAGGSFSHIVCEAGADWVRPINKRFMHSVWYRHPEHGQITLTSDDIDNAGSEEAALAAALTAKAKT